MYVHMYACTYICIHVRMYVYVHVVCHCTMYVCVLVALHCSARSYVPFRLVSTLGKISASTTISASSTVCLATWLRAEKSCRFSLASLLPTSWAKCAIAPASTTVCASWRKGEARGSSCNAHHYCTVCRMVIKDT